jgi:hypothetical protein
MMEEGSLLEKIVVGVVVVLAVAYIYKALEG